MSTKNMYGVLHVCLFCRIRGRPFILHIFSRCPVRSELCAFLLKLVSTCFSGPWDILPPNFKVGNYSKARGCGPWKEIKTLTDMSPKSNSGEISRWENVIKQRGPQLNSSPLVSISACLPLVRAAYFLEFFLSLSFLTLAAAHSRDLFLLISPRAEHRYTLGKRIWGALGKGRNV